MNALPVAQRTMPVNDYYSTTSNYMYIYNCNKENPHHYEWLRDCQQADPLVWRRPSGWLI